jgi:hypothetical protein
VAASVSDRQPGAFHTAAGGTVSAPLMNSVDPAADYHSLDGWQSAILPYTGADLVAVAILPPTSGTGRDVPAPEELAALTSTCAGQTATVLLPDPHLSQSWARLARIALRAHV